MPHERCVLGRDCPSLDPERGRRRVSGADTEEARAEAQDRRRLQQDLRNAAAAGGFALYYQARVSLNTGAITGTEAMLRWPHRRRGMMPPERFLPLAEHMGLGGKIGAWTLRTACAAAGALVGEATMVSVDVSPRQLQAPGFLDQLAGAIAESGVAAERIELELAESTLLGVDDDTLFLLSALRDLGVGLAMDDFGVGYASLGMLRRLPLTTLKLDRSLVRELPDNAEDAAIVQAVVATTHAMGLSVTATGVETEPQCGFLAGIGVDDGQGSLFGRPVAADRLREQLAA